MTSKVGRSSVHWPHRRRGSYQRPAETTSAEVRPKGALPRTVSGCSRRRSTATRPSSVGAVGEPAPGPGATAIIAVGTTWSRGRRADWDRYAKETGDPGGRQSRDE